MARFIAQEAATYPVTTLCRLLRVSSTAYYARLNIAPPPTDPVVEAVCTAFWRHSRRYGSRRLEAELKAEGVAVGRHRIRRVMRQQGLQAIQPKRFVPRTTDSRHGGQMSPNLLLGRALPEKPNEVLVGDITYLPLLDGGWAYLATWEDLYSRLIAGWQVEETMEEVLVIKAMEMVIRRRVPSPGLIVHSDRGGQYVSGEFRRLLKRHGFEQSMSRADETYDNAFAESLFSRYKAELLEGGAFLDVAEARLETFNYIEGYYNRVRRHSALGYQSPADFEQQYYAREKENFDKPSEEGVGVKQHLCPRK